MADSYSVQAVLSVKDKNFTSTMKSATNVLSGLDSSTSKSSSSVGALGTAFAVAEKVVSAACNVIKNSVQAAVERVDTLNQFPQVMQQMGFSAEESEKSINKLSDGIMGLPTSLDSIVSSTQSIALITNDLDEATDVALALNDAFLASGSSTAQASSGMEAYNKMLSTGKVNQQNWITLQQNMGWALSEVSGKLGYATDNTWELYYAMQDGTVTFDDFNSALIECDTAAGGFAETAQVSTAGIATSWQNVQTAVVRGVANMIQAWNDAAVDNSLPTIQESLNSLRNVVDTVFNAATKAVTVFVSNLDLLVSACAPAVAGIAALKVVETVGKQFEATKNKIQESAKVLQDYQSKAETTAAAAEKLQRAEEMAQTAQEKYNAAVDKAADKLREKQAAEQQASAAADALKQAEEELASATDNTTAAQQNRDQAAKAVEEADKAAAEAAKVFEEAEAAKAAAEKESVSATEYNTAAQKEYAAAIEGTTLKEIAMSAISNVLTGDMTVAQAAVQAFNAAWDANPIGLVITAITTAISVISSIITVLKKFGIIEDGAAKQSKEFKQEVEDLTDSIEANRDAMEDNTSSAQNQSSIVNELCSNIVELANNENKSAEDTSLLRTYIDQLNDSVDGLGLVYDETTDSLNMATEAMLAQAEVDNKANEKAVAQENYNTAMEDYLALSHELEAAAELEAETADAGIIAKQRQKTAIQELEDAQAEQAEVLDETLNAMQEAEAAYTAAQQEAYALQEAALAESVANQTLTLDQLSEANQATVQELQSTWQDYTDAATNMFDVLDTEVETTVDDMIENMQKNQEIMAQWGDNTEALRDRFANLGLDPAILDQLVDLGPEGAGYIQELVDASDDKLIELEQTYSEGGETAYTAMCQSLGEGATEVIEQAKNLVTQTEDSFREQVEATDWTSVGTDINEGVAEGMEDTSSFDGATQQAATDIEEDYRSATQTNSPSEMTKPIGTDLNEGIAEGMKETESLASAAEEVATTVEESLRSAFEAMDFSDIWDGLAETATISMEQVSQAVTDGMTLVQNAITSGMQTASTAMTTGFTNMGSSVSSEMSTIASVVSSGMANVSTVMTSGVQGVRTALTEGFSGMSSAVTSAMSSIQSAVSSGMSSVTSTMTSGVNNVKTVLTNGFQNMATTVNTQMNKIKSTITTTMNSIKSTMTTQLNNLKTTWTNTMNSIQTTTTNGMNKVKSAFTNAMSSIRSSASSTKSSIISTFNSMYSGMYSAGCNAMSGLQAGLNARSGSVLATARSIANSVTSTINSALKVGSPSRVMKSTGKDTIQGLVNGMKAMLSDVKDMSVKIADTVSDMVFGSFDSPQLAFEGGMDMSVDYFFDNEDMMDALGDIKTALAEREPIDITVPLEIDGKEFAKATYSDIQDQITKSESRTSRRDKFSISGG